jgi:hypothetical protein
LTSDENVASEDQDLIEREEQKFLKDQRSSSKGTAGSNTSIPRGSQTNSNDESEETPRGLEQSKEEESKGDPEIDTFFKEHQEFVHQNDPYPEPSYR